MIMVQLPWPRNFLHICLSVGVGQLLRLAGPLDHHRLRRLGALTPAGGASVLGHEAAPRWHPRSRVPVRVSRGVRRPLGPHARDTHGLGGGHLRRRRGRDSRRPFSSCSSSRRRRSGRPPGSLECLPHGNQRLELGLESIELPAELDRVRSFRALGRLVLGELRAARNGGVLEKKGAV